MYTSAKPGSASRSRPVSSASRSSSRPCATTPGRILARSTRCSWRLIRDVAPGQAPVLRIGGNSTDNTWWPLPDVTPSPGDHVHADQELARHHPGPRRRDRREADPGRQPEARQRGRGRGRGATPTAPASAPRTSRRSRSATSPSCTRCFRGTRSTASRSTRGPRSTTSTSYTQELAEIAGQVRGFALAGPATGTPQWFAEVPQLFHFEHSAEGRHLPPLSVARLLLGAGRPTLPLDPESAQPGLRARSADGRRRRDRVRAQARRHRSHRRAQLGRVRGPARGQRHVRVGAVDARHAVRDGPLRGRRRQHPHASHGLVQAVRVPPDSRAVARPPSSPSTTPC